MWVSRFRIWGTVHESATAQLQYVDTKDLSAYVKALVDNREQVIQDVDYIQVLHQKHFQGSNPKYENVSTHLSFVTDSYV